MMTNLNLILVGLASLAAVAAETLVLADCGIGTVPGHPDWSSSREALWFYYPNAEPALALLDYGDGTYPWDIHGTEFTFENGAKWRVFVDNETPDGRYAGYAESCSGQGEPLYCYADHGNYIGRSHDGAQDDCCSAYVCCMRAPCDRGSLGDGDGWVTRNTLFPHASGEPTCKPRLEQHAKGPWNARRSVAGAAAGNGGGVTPNTGAGGIYDLSLTIDVHPRQVHIPGTWKNLLSLAKISDAGTCDSTPIELDDETSIVFDCESVILPGYGDRTARLLVDVLDKLHSCPVWFGPTPGETNDPSDDGVRLPMSMEMELLYSQTGHLWGNFSYQINTTSYLGEECVVCNRDGFDKYWTAAILEGLAPASDMFSNVLMASDCAPEKDCRGD